MRSYYEDPAWLVPLSIAIAVLFFLSIPIAIYGLVRLMDKTTPWRYTAEYCQPDNYCYYSSGDVHTHDCPTTTGADLFGTKLGKIKGGTCQIVEDR